MKRKTYRIDLRRPGARWVPQTRVKTRREAEMVKDTWAFRGFEVQIVEEK